MPVGTTHSKKLRTSAEVTVGLLLMIGLYYGGFPVGEKIYGTVSGSSRVGFSTWSRLYRPLLFQRAGNEGYRYSEIGRVITFEGEFQSVIMTDDVMHLNFVQPNGREFLVRWNPDLENFPAFGKVHRGAIRVTFGDDGKFKKRFNLPATMNVDWWVGGQLIALREMP